MRLNWNQGELAEGLRCYRAKEFFEAHEHWEIVWLGSTEPLKSFLQGLIQMAAAFHHLQHDNPLGTRLLLERARARFKNYPEYFAGINVNSLLRETGEWLAALDREGAAELRSYPQLHVDAQDGGAK